MKVKMGKRRNGEKEKKGRNLDIPKVPEGRQCSNVGCNPTRGVHPTRGVVLRVV